MSRRVGCDCMFARRKFEPSYLGKHDRVCPTHVRAGICLLGPHLPICRRGIKTKHPVRRCETLGYFATISARHGPPAFRRGVQMRARRASGARSCFVRPYAPRVDLFSRRSMRQMDGGEDAERGHLGLGCHTLAVASSWWSRLWSLNSASMSLQQVGVTPGEGAAYALLPPCGILFSRD